MSRDQSHNIDRAETKAAKAAEQQAKAAVIWGEIEADRRAVDDRTERLRALRLARASDGRD
ncbi:hypothetical protein [Methylobacterium haplocladii]|uniref:Uncharacterized protein n=1 Tax=Methylobacterium haplocladii TaxID=1176176 RepID=A0A512IKY2_9HYPH|nr:hypothetical protein [Methylobacterium haplocladii]GEO98335.1 hypothetical protein MHA02_07230 [Methylobacterium haplocladii]GJD82963.1 hypothetical protein HPGCJGGD_0825 [Methylobacterium haplocladii]GLS58728.1 hypothetical protein GCM10007887_13930 [Methylobacterium haplocladii]